MLPMGQMCLASLYNIARGIYEGRILCTYTSYSRNDCSHIDEHGKGHSMVMMTESLANVLSSVGADVRYPHGVQVPSRSNYTNARAEQMRKVQVQSVQDYKDQYRKMIHDILKD